MIKSCTYRRALVSAGQQRAFLSHKENTVLQLTLLVMMLSKDAYGKQKLTGMKKSTCSLPDVGQVLLILQLFSGNALVTCSVSGRMVCLTAVKSSHS